MDWIELCQEAALLLPLPTDAESSPAGPWDDLWTSVCLGATGGQPPDEDAEFFWVKLSALPFPSTAIDFVMQAKSVACELVLPDPFADSGDASWAGAGATTASGLDMQWDATRWRWFQPALEVTWQACLSSLWTAWNGVDEAGWAELVLGPLKAAADSAGVGWRFTEFQAESQTWSTDEKWAYIAPWVKLLTVEELTSRLRPTPRLDCWIDGAGRAFQVEHNTWDKVLQRIVPLKRGLCEQLLRAQAVTLVGKTVHAAPLAEDPPCFDATAEDYSLFLRCRMTTGGGPLGYAIEVIMHDIRPAEANRLSWKHLKTQLDIPGTRSIHGNLRDGLVLLPSNVGFLAQFLSKAQVPGTTFDLVRTGDGFPRRRVVGGLGRGMRPKRMQLTAERLGQDAVAQLSALLQEAGMTGIDILPKAPAKAPAKKRRQEGDPGSEKGAVPLKGRVELEER